MGFSPKLGTGLYKGIDKPHFSFMKFMINFLEAASSGFFFVTNKATGCIGLV